MQRFILVDFERRVVEPASFFTQQAAWARARELAKEQERSPYEWEIVAITVEAV